MNGLVSYDSSSDEESAASKNAQSSPETLATAFNHETASTHYQQQTQAEASINAHAASEVVRPLVGPMAPKFSAFAGANDEQRETMSERDTIRYLTQATHPMTSIPPSPPGTPEPGANARIKRFLDLKARGVHFNADLASKTTFRNPGLFSTVLARAGVEPQEQYQTSISREVWDPAGLPAWAYKEELLKSQRKVRDGEDKQKQTLSVAGKRTVDFTSAAHSEASSTVSSPGKQSKRRRP